MVDKRESRIKTYTSSKTPVTSVHIDNWHTMQSTLTAVLGEPIGDVEEEAFLTFSQPIPSQSLGFVDSKSTLLHITIGDIELEITQSPSLLNSNREEGTTGAVVWKVTPVFARFLLLPDNFLFQNGFLDPSSTVLELGCGVSGILPLTLSTRVNRYIATDLAYTLRLCKDNIHSNQQNIARPVAGKKAKATPCKKKKRENTDDQSCGNILTIPLDWETSEISSLPEALDQSHDSSDRGVDIILACDCIYNDALIDPFVRTCADICALRRPSDDANETVCVIAQQLRSSEVFEAWLQRFSQQFLVWKVNDDVLKHCKDDLGEGSGFILHIGILKR